MAGLAGPLQTVHRRRARYLEQLGEHDRAAAELRQAEALQPSTALDWFLAGYDRWLAGDVRERGQLHASPPPARRPRTARWSAASRRPNHGAALASSQWAG